MGAKRSELRIIGGKWKGRKLHFTDAPGLRPTLGRTRETLFNWLRPTLAGARCLDLFAGSGILGFEALSQGAESVCMVEKHGAAAAALKRNRADLDCEERCAVVRQDVRAYLRRAGTAQECFDVVFVDAPFDQPALLTRTIETIKTERLARRLIYVEAREHSLLSSLADDRWHLSRQTRAGDAHAALFSVQDPAQAVAAPEAHR